MTNPFEILDSTSSDSRPQPESRQFGDLIIAFTTTYTRRRNDQGCGMGNDGSFWHPVPPAGFRALGSIAVSYDDDPNGKFASLCVKAAPGRESALASPTGYEAVYSDSGSGADMNGSCWRPTPPVGYLALGDVFVTGYGAPPLGDVACVQQNLVHPGRIAQGDTWSHRRPEGDVDFACWQIETSATLFDTPDGVLAVNSFVGTAGDRADTPPSSSAVNWNLRLPLPGTTTGETAAKPLLRSRTRPPARTSPVVDRIVTVPFTALLDPDRTLTEKVQHPFYEVMRLVDYTLVEFVNNPSGKAEETTLQITTGITSEESSAKQGISITADHGVRIGEPRLGMSASLSSVLGYSVAASASQFQSQTDEVTLTCPPRRAAAVWVESHRIRIVRSDGTVIGPDISLNPSKTACLLGEFPERQKPMSRAHRASEDGSAIERRIFPRVQLSTPLPARLGRTEGVVIDLSARGVRIRHANAVPLGDSLSLTFTWGSRECTATAKVVSSRLVSLGTGSPLPPFESRLALVYVPRISEHLLSRLSARGSAVAAAR